MKKKEKYVYIAVLASVVLVFIGFTLTKFNKDIQKRVYKLQISSMQNISKQGGAVVEKNLEGMVNTLYALTNFLVEDEDFANDEHMEKLRDFAQERNVMFQRFGIADASGNAKVTNGEKINISSRQYFQECMKNKKASSEIKKSALIEEMICIIAVPILKDGEAIGVLYGCTDLKVFNIYENTILENEKTYIQVIDPDGTYIVKEPSGILGKRDNIFDGLSRVESQTSLQEIQEKVKNEEPTYIEISDGECRETVCFTPLKLNHWCVVTVMDQSRITNSIDYILGHDVYIMIIRVAVGVLLLSSMILYFSWQEKRQIEEFNERLLIDEKLFRIASEKSGVIIMSYIIKTKQLHFINPDMFGLKLPDKIDNAPENFVHYLSDKNKNLHEELHTILKNMENEEGKRTFFVTVKHSDQEELILRIQLTSLFGTNGEIRQCIGVIEDATETQHLREKADRDSLTGLYNRSYAVEKINGMLQEFSPAPECVHACVLMDLDNFKKLNDTLGHQKGDQALQDVANILRQHFREYDIVCRLGGDEFLIFVQNIPRNVIEKNIGSLLKKLTLTYEKEEKKVCITVSAGIYLVKEPGHDFRELYQKADETLYRVKNSSKNGYRIYGQTLNGSS
ncbi:hypothetical protein JCM17039_10920 [Blautia glucerasea]